MCNLAKKASVLPSLFNEKCGKEILSLPEKSVFKKCLNFDLNRKRQHIRNFNYIVHVINAEKHARLPKAMVTGGAVT